MQLEWELEKNIVYEKGLNELVDSPVLAQILANRGIDTIEKAKLFLNPQNYPLSSPENFLDIPKAVNRIKQAIEQKQNIVICGDFDCDGVTSTAVLYKTLAKIGANVASYIPNRQTENHGLNSKAIVEIISRKKAKLIITVDNGISNNAEIKLAQSLGVDVIVTDHHEPPEVLPEAFAIINPKCSDFVTSNIDFVQMQSMVNFAGVFVAYKLASALLDEFNFTDYKKELLPYVTLGTISDVMPLTMENRAIVSLGLAELRKNPPKWLKKIFELAQRSLDVIESETLAFTVAPRINAAGRLEQATTALDLLVSNDEEKINFCANQLQQFNQNRQQMCDTCFQEVVVRIKNEINLKTTKAIVLADEKWHIGIVGLLASRIVENYHRPAFIMSISKEENQARCSIRGIKGMSVHKVLLELGELFEGFGGHELAGGFAVDLNKISVKELSRRINQVVSEQLEDEALKRKIHIDAILEPEELTLDFIEKLSLLEPYGEGNQSCVFGMKDLVLKKFDVIGNNAHLKMLFEAPNGLVFEGLIWNKNTHNIELLDKADVTLVPKINEFKGKKSIQLILKNIYITNRDIKVENIEFDSAQIDVPTVIDHRHKDDAFKMLNSYLPNSSALVYLENRMILEQLSNYQNIKSVVKNRFELSENEELFFMSMPASEDEFLRIIKKVSPEKIHMLNSSDKKIEVAEFLKTLSGMLKYCFTHNSGRIEINKSVIYLSCSKKAFECAMELLAQGEIIKISSQDDTCFEFVFLESKPLSALTNNQYYFQLIQEIEKINDFRENLQSCDISQIEEMLFI